MKMTRHDTVIGRVRGGAVETASPRRTRAKPTKTLPTYRLRRSDTHQMTWPQLCRHVGINTTTWWYRVTRYNYGKREALLAPVEPYRHVTMPMIDLCRITGVNYHTYMARRQRRYTVRQALGVDPPPARPRRT